MSTPQACEMDGDIIDTYGGEHYWHCGQPGVLTAGGMLLCEDHAGELGYGPRQEEYGFDPHDGLNPAPACPVCRDTGIVQCPEQDGDGMYEQACPERVHNGSTDKACVIADEDMMSVKDASPATPLSDWDW